MKTIISIFVTTAWLFLLPLVLRAENAANEKSGIQTVKIVLHPMPEPKPALKYKFLPSYIDLKPGNAALFYDRIPAEKQAFFNDDNLQEKACDWAAAPLADLQKEDVRKKISGFRWLVQEVKRASQCETCDWQTPVREGGYLTLLPDVQQNRTYARFIAPYIRLQIADGNFDEAADALQAGYALGQDVAKGPCLVQALVGCAITGMMSDQVRDFIQQPDAPNLYWSLTNLPSPIIDFRRSFEVESDMLYVHFPDLYGLDKKDIAPDQWRLLLNQNVEKMLQLHRLFGNDYSSISCRTAFFSTALVLAKYPQAKAFLINRGWSAEKIESMPICQTVMVAALRQYNEMRDDIFKGLCLPYPEAHKEAKKFEAKLHEIFQKGEEIMPIGSMLLPAISGAKNAEIRTQRDIVILRVFEAIRLYGAAHNGQLPDRLSDITEVPVPLDPLNGMAFIYNRIGDTAILESPAPSGTSISYWLRYEIRFAKKGN